MSPDLPRVPLCEPLIIGNERRYVDECIASGWVSSVGRWVEDFEARFARCVGANHAVAVASGTAALHLGLLVAGVERDDEVLVSALTFIAPVNAIRYVGAWPVLIDCDATSGQIDVGLVREFLLHRCERRDGSLWNKASGRRVRALLPVHILGHAAPIAELKALADEAGIIVVEDATEGLGAAVGGRSIGTFGHSGAFSFNGNKLVTTGGGGMLVTDDERVAQRARYLSTQAKDDPVEFTHGAVGFNYRLSNIQAAFGCAQLERLDEIVARKRKLALRYCSALAAVDGISPIFPASGTETSWWLFTVRVDPGKCSRTSRELMRDLAAAGVTTRPLWTPIHRSPVYAQAERMGGNRADELHELCLSLPSSAGLSEADQDRVLDVIRRAA